MDEIRFEPVNRRVLTAVLALTLVLTVVPVASGEEAVPEAVSVEGEFLLRAGEAEVHAAGLDFVADVGFGWSLARIPIGDGAITTSADALADATGIEVEPNYIYELFEDPLYEDQWSLENTGQSGGTSDADIDIEGAWPETTGEGVVVAVLDTGVDLDHVDIASNLWSNSGETPGNGIDDDGNGYIDDVNGWNMWSNNSNPDDFYWHGTFVATTVLAPENGAGMVGVAPDASVMAIRVCGFSGPDVICPDADILEGLEYAIDNGADVINLSLGGFGASVAIENAINDAVDAGVSVVAAAGNYSLDNDIIPTYPSSYDIDGLISVAATDHDDQLADFSNYGSDSVDLAAPGDLVLGGDIGSSWGYASGTSFAAPHVAGVAALLASARPELSPAEIEAAIKDSVDQKSSLSGWVETGGRLNAAKAVALACGDGGEADGDDLLLYQSGGPYWIVDVGISGCVYETIKAGTYSASWTHIEAVDLNGDGEDELLFYRSTNGGYAYYELNENGTLGALLSSGTWGTGWYGVEPVNLDADPQDELMFYRKSNGGFAYYNLTSTGIIGSAVRAGKIGAGWTSVEPVDVDGNGNHEMLFYRASTGGFAFYNLASFGTIGTSILAGKWGAGWDIIEPSDLDGDGTDELIFYRDSDGRYVTYDLSLGGYIGSNLGAGFHPTSLISITSPR